VGEQVYRRLEEGAVSEVTAAFEEALFSLRSIIDYNREFASLTCGQLRDFDDCALWRSNRK